MKYVLLSIVIVSACIVSCKNNPSGKELMPEISQTDSILIVYFRSADSVENIFLPLNDEEFIEEIVHDLSAKVQDNENCKPDGRIHCYQNGQQLNTITFAYSTKDCNQFQCVNKGDTFQFNISDDVKEKLLKFKSFAREQEQDSITDR